MRLTLDPRARALLRALPRTRLYAVPELLLLSVLAWQIARLIWAIVTPVSPLGDWRAAANAAIAPPPGVLGTFDPFFRLSGESGPVTVTDLNLKLFGVRADQATGKGSAIIGLPDGTQASIAVGEEIAPGVTLQAVGLDAVTILRNGSRQMLYLDQSQPAGGVAPPPGAPAQGLPPGLPEVNGVAPATLAAQIGASPRIRGGRVDGVTLQPRGDGAAFRAAGLQPGDVLLSVNGTRIAGVPDIAALPELVGRSPQATIEVERGGQATTLSVGIAR